MIIRILVDIYCRVTELSLYDGLAATTAQHCLMQSRSCTKPRKIFVFIPGKSAVSVLSARQFALLSFFSSIAPKPHVNEIPGFLPILVAHVVGVQGIFPASHC